MCVFGVCSNLHTLINHWIVPILWQLRNPNLMFYTHFANCFYQLSSNYLQACRVHFLKKQFAFSCTKFMTVFGVSNFCPTTFNYPENDTNKRTISVCVWGGGGAWVGGYNTPFEIHKYLHVSNAFSRPPVFKKYFEAQVN